MSSNEPIDGGQIDRSRTLNSRSMAKAIRATQATRWPLRLLANGVRLMGRSFKYHRPRGPLSAGSEEPNAIVELRGGARKEPNTRATTAELYDGLDRTFAEPLARRAFDAMAVNDRFSNF